MTTIFLNVDLEKVTMMASHSIQIRYIAVIVMI